MIAPALQSSLYTGWMRHRRFAPVRHAFRYRQRMILLDLAELDRVFAGRWFWSTRRFAPIRFRRKDYLGDPSIPLDEAARDLVQKHLGERPSGPVRLLTQLRSFGYGFNPVSFYYCYDGSPERLHSIIAEITNTPWSERHCYVLRTDSDDASSRFHFDKAFHVSPFMSMAQQYDWRLSRPGKHAAIHMKVAEDGRSLFDATVVMKRRPITGVSLAGALLRQPVGPAVALVRIYLHALRLWLKRCPFHPHPRHHVSTEVGSP